MDGSGLGEFANQIVGLLVITFGAGILWIALTVLIFRRAAERRRRKREGGEPLPSFYEQAVTWVRKQLNPPMVTTSTTPAPKPSLPPSPVDDLPIPDIEALTASLPTAHYLTADPPPPKPAAVAVAASRADSPQAVQGYDEPQLDDAPADAIEIMRVWRDLIDGKLLIGMKGQVFTSLQELQNADLAPRFANLAKELMQFTQQHDAPAHPRPAPPPAESDEGDSEDASIAGQIEAFLQQKLFYEPDFASRSLHVRPSAGGGVQIEVDGRYYEGIGDIEDEAIQAFLQQTIQEWEARQ